MFTDYDRGTQALLKNVQTDRVFITLHNLVLIFHVEIGLRGRSENIEYLWHSISSFFHRMFWKIMAHKIKMTAMTLRSYIKVIVWVTFHNCAYISAILGLILTKFRP